MRESATVIILSNDKKNVLLIKRRDIPVWVLPGGGCLNNENPKYAAIRETLEETGLTVIIKRKIATYLPVNKLTTITHFFECSILSGELTTGNETKDIAFFPIEKLPQQLVPTYRSFINDALKNLDHTIEKKTENASYFMLIKYLILNPIITIRFLMTKIGIHINN